MVSAARLNFGLNLGLNVGLGPEPGLGLHHGSEQSDTVAVVSFNLLPKRNPTCKYERLGPMAITNQRQYCERHGYGYYSATPVSNQQRGSEFAQPLAANEACWAKLPEILQALQTHRWVLWADSDALIFDFNRRLEDFCDPRFDVITQCPRGYFNRIGLDPVKGLARQPLNSGVLLFQATQWTRNWLRQALALKPPMPPSDDWHGLGDQEALIAVLQQSPADLRRIGYVQNLQAHPSLHGPGNMFVHFYGNQAQHCLALDTVEAVLQRWERAVAQGGSLPKDLARFHWCCIQNKQADAAVNRGGPERFLYRPCEIEGEIECAAAKAPVLEAQA